MNGIKQDIVSGKVSPGDRLSSVRELAEALSVNPNTVQRVYQELEREGISETRRGTGTYILENPELIPRLKAEMAKSVLRKFIDGMRSLGLSNREIASAIDREIAGGTN
ncbi:MAG TPA: GntR family transcriptional regulator [Treponemataceae bacterium]|nr:GntR family transcriptional regulator [Treponemataceae bacterium]